MNGHTPLTFRRSRAAIAKRVLGSVSTIFAAFCVAVVDWFMEGSYVGSGWLLLVGVAWGIAAYRMNSGTVSLYRNGIAVESADSRRRFAFHEIYLMSNPETPDVIAAIFLGDDEVWPGDECRTFVDGGRLEAVLLSKANYRTVANEREIIEEAALTHGWTLRVPYRYRAVTVVALGIMFMLGIALFLASKHVPPHLRDAAPSIASAFTGVGLAGLALRQWLFPTLRMTPRHITCSTIWRTRRIDCRDVTAYEWRNTWWGRRLTVTDGKTTIAVPFLLNLYLSTEHIFMNHIAEACPHAVYTGARELPWIVKPIRDGLYMRWIGSVVIGAIVGFVLFAFDGIVWRDLAIGAAVSGLAAMVAYRSFKKNNIVFLPDSIQLPRFGRVESIAVDRVVSAIVKSDGTTLTLLHYRQDDDSKGDNTSIACARWGLSVTEFVFMWSVLYPHAPLHIQYDPDSKRVSAYALKRDKSVES